MALPVIAAAAKGAVVASKAVKGAKIASAVSKGVKAGKIVPKLNVTNMKSVFTDENTDTYVKSLKEAVKSGGKLRTAKRRKSKQSVAEIKADIDAREAKKAKIKPSKLLPPPEMGLKLEEKVKLNSEKITKIISIQKLHKTNHKKEKDEITEISSVLTNIADFIKKDYDDRIKGEEDKTDKLKELEGKRAQKEEEKGLESSKKTGEKIGKRSLGIVQPVQSIFDKLLNAVAAIGIGIGGTAIFDYFSNPENFQKLNGFFDFIKKHWKWVLGGIGVIAAIAIVGPIIAIGSAIAGVVAAIAGVAVVVGKIALAVAAVVGVIMGASSIFRWLRGGKEAQEARIANKETLKESGIEEAFGAGYRVMRDGKKKTVRYKNLTDEEKVAVDKFKKEDKRIKEVTAERNKTSKERKKQISKDRQATDEYAEIQVMPAGKDRRIAEDEFKRETIRLQNESDKKTAAEFAEKMKMRKIGGDTSGMTLVGEGGPEIVDFKTASSVKTAQRTQELLKDISQDGGVNIITMDLPPIKATPPQVSADSGTPSTEVEMIASVNPFNSYMSITPDILKID